MSLYDVYGLGNALVDIEFEVSDSFLKEEKIDKGLMTLIDDTKLESLLSSLTNYNKKKIIPGGSAANTIAAVSQLGGKCFYSCKVANDYEGQFYLDNLKELNVDTFYKREILPKGTTGRCLVMITSDAERTMNTYLGITSSISENELNEEAIKNSKYLYIEGYLVASPTGHAAALKAIEIARKNGVKIALTFSDVNMVKFFKKQIDELLTGGVDLLFCNAEEARAYCDELDLSKTREIFKEYAKGFAITLGKNGALVYDGTMFIDIEPYLVKAIDTNGAGDMFAGSFLYGITNKHTFGSSAQLASYACSKLVAQFGPRLNTIEMTSIKNFIFNQ